MKPNKEKEKYKPSEIEAKWQKVWEEHTLYSPDIDKAKKPYYNLMMFPYPSAEGMHVGNMYAFTGADVYGRYMRMKGYDVLEPIGLDGFGIHSENYAIKVGRHPKEQAKISQENFYRQLHATGNGFDWKRTVETYDPDYYRWTQWIFVQLFKAGLAYRAKAPVNYCPSCKTVLADEQVVTKLKSKNKSSNISADQGLNQRVSAKEQRKEREVKVCERCQTEIEIKNLEQWFFRITHYADRLLANLDKLDWSEKVKIAQKAWIGKKLGINITYQIEGISEKVTCFTTRPDTNFGATFIVIGPEHNLIQKIVKNDYSDAVKKYVEKTKKISEVDRIAQGRKKTGVFTGSYAINHLTGNKMPIWISDFVIGNVGTGAVVGVPGHDLRDFEFAQAMGLPIVRVVVGPDGDTSTITKKEQVQEESGTMINSDFLNGMDIMAAKERIMDYLVKKGWGQRVTSYHLRDWLISRQRYWGPPIPMIYCGKCASEGKSWFTTQPQTLQDQMKGWFPVKEADLPVRLPDVEDWRPQGSGTSPLANHPEFYTTTCPSCGSEARRETDVSDTFLDSAWYFFRYPSIANKNSKHETRNSKQIQKTKFQNNFEFLYSNFELPWDPQITKEWLPVDMYIGGAEHSVLHLLYARFITMVFHDLGLIDFEEPFTTFYAHGLLIKEGTKMSKSKGNVIIPDEYIKKFGADTVRTYLMFLGPFHQGGDFYDTGIEGMHRFLNRVWRLVSETQINTDREADTRRSNQHESILDRVMHRTIQEVTKDIQDIKYNTAIAKIMEYYNALHNFCTKYQILDTKYYKTLVLLLAPFAPHMAEELWQSLRDSEIHADQAAGIHRFNTRQSIHLQAWPQYDPSMIQDETVTIVVQVDGKVRNTLLSQKSKMKSQKQMEELAKQTERVKRHLAGKNIRKVIYIEGKIINFVTS